MYDRQPLYRPNGAPPNLPPFPPNLSANGGVPSQFPPFPPAHGFVPPPFPPNLPPTNYASSTPPMRPPQTPNAQTPRPAHPGLGLPPLPTGMPAPPHLATGSSPTNQAAPAFVREVKTISVFVGGIAPGIKDDTMKDLLNACGPLHELKRVVGASGKPQAFGFALYESPEVVMRCIRCLNGVELPDMSSEGRSRHTVKPLVVKVDDKTKEFLDEFEQALGRSDDDETADSICRRAIAHVVNRVTDPNAAAPPGIVLRPGQSQMPLQVVVPAHLQDLKEGDLPENQRVAVLDQIAVFREAAARNERDKRKPDVEPERYRSSPSQSNGHAGPSDYGYGNRALAKDVQRQARQWQQQTSQQSPMQDPQSYSEPVKFVPAETLQAKADSNRTDEEEEQLRIQRKDQERDNALRERERRVEARERGRIDTLTRELAYRKQQADLEDRARKQMEEKLSLWDDEERTETGREPFFADRERWRSQRQTRRTVEYQDDVRDRQSEEDEMRALERESEEFLRKQLADMAELEEAQRQKGLLTEDIAPIKLAIENRQEREARVSGEPALAKVAATVAFGADEDEEAMERKRRRTFVKLDDAGSAPSDELTTEAEIIAQRNARLLEIRRHVPRDRRRLWAYKLHWSALDESRIQRKIRPFLQEQMKHYLGEKDDDLVDFMVEKLGDRCSPETLIDGIEPVLAEETAAFVSDLWRLLVFESMAYDDGLESGALLAA